MAAFVPSILKLARRFDRPLGEVHAPMTSFGIPSMCSITIGTPNNGGFRGHSRWPVFTGCDRQPDPCN